jgi:hypothetical protein|tara:strand:- start:236 stop:745 length:510 start_codon:yes stop_codon:yes gene_type:complete
MPVISGKSFWAKLHQAQNPFDPDKPRWSIDVALDKKGVKQMESEGCNIKNKDDDRGDFVTIYKDQFLTDGTELPKPRVMDSQKNLINGTLIGNGSLVNVSYKPRSWTMGNRKGVRPVLRDVQVVKLVEYTAPDEFDVEDTGYVYTTSDDIPFEASVKKNDDLELSTDFE